MIHFASFYCPDLDRDLLDAWLAYYLSMRFESYTVFLNTRQLHEENLFTVRDRMKQSGVSVRVAIGPFNDGQLQSEVLREFSGTLPKDDFLVIADSDEFQTVPRNAYGGYDVTRGVLVDRYADALIDAVTEPGRPVDCVSGLEALYPHAGNIEELIRQDLPPQYCNGWACTKREKICCTRAGYDVSYTGSHGFHPDFEKTILPSLRVDPVVYPVNHYTWRSGILRRMLGRSYRNAASAWYVWKFFGGQGTDYPPELAGAIEKEDLRHSTMWDPQTPPTRQDSL